VGNPRNYYEVNAVRLRDGNFCEIWVDRTVLVSDQDAQKIVAEFDANIQPDITGVFGSYNSIFGGGAGKIILFLLDIKDKYGKNGNQSYVAGYFDARDLMGYPYGNNAAMLYIDTYPNSLTSEQSYSTIAHELQHLINFANTVAYRSVVVDPDGPEPPYLLISPQDTWIDEGLSSAAEYIYRGGQHDTTSRGRIYHFNTDPYRSISKGNNFFVWGEDRPEGNDAILDEYATVYMFFQWLRLQSGEKNDIYTAIAKSGDWDYKAVTNAAASNFDGSSGSVSSSWETLLGAWHRANYLNTSSGPTGYRGDSNLKPRVWAVAGEKSYTLYPGEAVYSIYGSSVSSTVPGITYVSMTRSTNDKTNNPQYPSNDTNRLVMFNAIANVYVEKNGYLYFNDDTIKTGNLPGEGKDEDRSNSPAASMRNALGGGGPYVIDARDVRGRRGRETGINIQELNIEH
jgi:hypothetical protein